MDRVGSASRQAGTGIQCDTVSCRRGFVIFILKKNSVPGQEPTSPVEYSTKHCSASSSATLLLESPSSCHLSGCLPPLTHFAVHVQTDGQTTSVLHLASWEGPSHQPATLAVAMTTATILWRDFSINEQPRWRRAMSSSLARSPPPPRPSCLLCCRGQ